MIIPARPSDQGVGGCDPTTESWTTSRGHSLARCRQQIILRPFLLAQKLDNSILVDIWADSPLAQTWPTAKRERGTGSFPQTLLSYLTLRLSALFNICTMQAIVRLRLKDFIFYNLRVGFERFPSSPLRQACFGSSSTASLHSS